MCARGGGGAAGHRRNIWLCGRTIGGFQLATAPCRFVNPLWASCALICMTALVRRSGMRKRVLACMCDCSHSLANAQRNRDGRVAGRPRQRLHSSRAPERNRACLPLHGCGQCPPWDAVHPHRHPTIPPKVRPCSHTLHARKKQGRTYGEQASAVSAQFSSSGAGTGLVSLSTAAGDALPGARYILTYIPAFLTQCATYSRSPISLRR